jgi:hypothetical protein
MMSVIRIASRYANDCITYCNLSSLLVKKTWKVVNGTHAHKKYSLQNYIQLILVRRNKLGATELHDLLFQL